MTSVAEAVQTMKEKFNPAAAAGLDLIFGFNITDEDTHYALIVKDSTCELQEGENPDANVTLVMDSATLKGIVSGETDGMQAFMGGKLRAEGDMMLAMKLSELFPV
ncbi:SCP-2 sterol transfer protein [Pseudomonas coronafaciens pv. atropurpurea]|uniref:SCP2 sterol-binding domain-containing protein n=1 Tax=Pseudomonas coronafaciens TaxID=53409 RepID=UPI0006D62AB2|nr:SCP2 sterol-binding domain-containing protein [Pseudomonas coronafaciens]KPW41950.1 SCP-2 sterol transfer family protein [Pseudomonas coronafaciens pv. atropurpurea]RMT65313.1 SCP-2 sterol transfer protein [Pseudomonas coronafaciens pv. atropurpurea]